MGDEDKTTKGVVIPLQRNDEGAMRGVHVGEDGDVSLREFRPVKEGQPLMGTHYTSLTQREGSPLIDAETTELPTPAGCSAPTGTGHKGPPRVATDAYRAGWDRIFGNKGETGEA